MEEGEPEKERGEGVIKGTITSSNCTNCVIHTYNFLRRRAGEREVRQKKREG